jgi:putative addiction module CopG family antidote
VDRPHFEARAPGGGLMYAGFQEGPMTVTVELSPEMERFVSDKLGRGDFPSADEMMRVALQRMLEEEEEMAETATLLGEAEESGEYLELNDTVWASIEREAFEEVERRKAVR